MAKWLTHRFVDPTFVGSIPISRLFLILLGYSQAVRQQTLTLSFVGSNPATPVFFYLLIIWRCSQVVRHGSAKPSFVGSNPITALATTELFMPVWRNRQTRWTQNPVPSRACRFDPGHRYYNLKHDGKLLTSVRGFFI